MQRSEHGSQFLKMSGGYYFDEPVASDPVWSKKCAERDSAVMTLARRNGLSG